MRSTITILASILLLFIVVFTVPFSSQNLVGEAFRTAENIVVEPIIEDEFVELKVALEANQIYSTAYVETEAGWQKIELSDQKWLFDEYQAQVSFAKEAALEPGTYRILFYTCEDVCEPSWQLQEFTLVASMPNSTNSTNTTIILPPQNTGNLKDQIDNAPAITTQSFGPGPQAINSRGYMLIPNGNSWNVIFPYDRAYRSPSQLVMFNIDELDVRNQDSGFIPHYYHKNYEVVPTYDLTYNVDFRFRKFIFPDKVYIPMWTKYQTGETIYVYDIAQNKFVDPIPIPGNFVLIANDMTLDDKIRGFGYRRDSTHYHMYAYEFDPVTEQVVVSQPHQVPFEPIGFFSDYSHDKSRASGDYLVIPFIGTESSVLLSYNFRTQEWDELKTVAGRGTYKTFYPRNKYVDGTVTYNIEEVKDDTASQKMYMFKNGVFTQGTPQNLAIYEHPLFSELTFTKQQRNDIKKQFFASTLDVSQLTYVPEVTRFWPDENGALNYLITKPNNEQIEVPAQVYMYNTAYVAIGSMGNYLYGAASKYGQQVVYNTVTQDTFRAKGGTSVRTVGDIDGEIYFSGYPRFSLRVIDPVAETYKDSLNKPVDTHNAVTDFQKGSDGLIYFGGHYFRTRANAGGIAWYDPNTNTQNGIPLDGHRPFWSAAINNGETIIFSTKGEGGNLFYLDAQTKEYEKRMTPEFFPGHITGVDNHLIGYGTHVDYGAFIYRYDPTREEFIWTQPVPYNPVTASNLIEGNAYIFFFDETTRTVYTNIDKTLVQVDIDDGSIDILGKLSQVKSTTKHKGELYQAGGTFRKLILP